MATASQQKETDSTTPRKVIVKTMTVSRNVDTVFEFFKNVKNMETGGILKDIREREDGWWRFSTPAGEAKLKLDRALRELGVIDHVFVGGGLVWQVYVRIVPNQDGSTASWTFIRPDGLDDKQFEEQLAAFNIEIEGWKKALESTSQ
jgi:GMP synthase PP-ATPase subunit